MGKQRLDPNRIITPTTIEENLAGDQADLVNQQQTPFSQSVDSLMTDNTPPVLIDYGYRAPITELSPTEIVTNPVVREYAASRIAKAVGLDPSVVSGNIDFYYEQMTGKKFFGPKGSPFEDFANHLHNAWIDYALTNSPITGERAIVSQLREMDSRRPDPKNKAATVDFERRRGELMERLALSESQKKTVSNDTASRFLSQADFSTEAYARAAQYSSGPMNDLMNMVADSVPGMLDILPKAIAGAVIGGWAAAALAAPTGAGVGAGVGTAAAPGVGTAAGAAVGLVGTATVAGVIGAVGGAWVATETTMVEQTQNQQYRKLVALGMEPGQAAKDANLQGLILGTMFASISGLSLSGGSQMARYMGKMSAAALAENAGEALASRTALAVATAGRTLKGKAFDAVADLYTDSVAQALGTVGITTIGIMMTNGALETARQMGDQVDAQTLGDAFKELSDAFWSNLVVGMAAGGAGEGLMAGSRGVERQLSNLKSQLSDVEKGNPARMLEVNEQINLAGAAISRKDRAAEGSSPIGFVNTKSLDLADGGLGTSRTPEFTSHITRDDVLTAGRRAGGDDFSKVIGAVLDGVQDVNADTMTPDQIRAVQLAEKFAAGENTADTRALAESLGVGGNSRSVAVHLREGSSLVRLGEEGVSSVAEARKAGADVVQRQDGSYVVLNRDAVDFVPEAGTTDKATREEALNWVKENAGKPLPGDAVLAHEVQKLNPRYEELNEKILKAQDDLAGASDDAKRAVLKSEITTAKEALQTTPTIEQVKPYTVPRGQYRASRASSFRTRLMESGILPEDHVDAVATLVANLRNPRVEAVVFKAVDEATVLGVDKAGNAAIFDPETMKGAYEVKGNQVIAAKGKADVETVIHELAHAVEASLKPSQKKAYLNAIGESKWTTVGKDSVSERFIHDVLRTLGSQVTDARKESLSQVSAFLSANPELAGGTSTERAEAINKILFGDKEKAVSTVELRLQENDEHWESVKNNLEAATDEVLMSYSDRPEAAMELDARHPEEERASHALAVSYKSLADFQEEYLGYAAAFPELVQAKDLSTVEDIYWASKTYRDPVGAAREWVSSLTKEGVKTRLLPEAQRRGGVIERLVESGENLNAIKSIISEDPYTWKLEWDQELYRARRADTFALATYQDQLAASAAVRNQWVKGEMPEVRTGIKMGEIQEHEAQVAAFTVAVMKTGKAISAEADALAGKVDDVTAQHLRDASIYIENVRHLPSDYVEMTKKLQRSMEKAQQSASKKSGEAAAVAQRAIDRLNVKVERLLEAAEEAKDRSKAIKYAKDVQARFRQAIPDGVDPEYIRMIQGIRDQFENLYRTRPTDKSEIRSEAAMAFREIEGRDPLNQDDIDKGLKILEERVRQEGGSGMQKKLRAIERGKMSLDELEPEELDSVLQNIETLIEEGKELRTRKERMKIVAIKEWGNDVARLVVNRRASVRRRLEKALDSAGIDMESAKKVLVEEWKDVYETLGIQTPQREPDEVDVMSSLLRNSTPRERDAAAQDAFDEEATEDVGFSKEQILAFQDAWKRGKDARKWKLLSGFSQDASVLDNIMMENNSALAKAILQPLRDAHDKKYRMIEEAFSKWDQAVKDAGLGKEFMLARREIPGYGWMSVDDALGTYLASKDSKTKRQMLSANFHGDEAAMEAAIGSVTEAERKVGDSMMQLLNDPEYQDKVQKAYEDVSGRAFPMISDGTYWPRRREAGVQSRDMMTVFREAIDDELNLRNSSASSSFSKSRTSNDLWAFQLGASQVFARHVEEVATYSHMHEPAAMLHSLVENEGSGKRALSAVGGDYLLNELGELAVMAESSMIQTTGIDKVLGKMTGNVVKSVLGGVASTLVNQTAAWIEGSVEDGPQMIPLIMANSILSAVPAFNDAERQSAVVSGSIKRGLERVLERERVLLSSETTEKGKTRGLRAAERLLVKATDAGMMPMTYIDYWGKSGIWKSKYQIEMLKSGRRISKLPEEDRGPATEAAEIKARAMADELVRRTQMPTMDMDRPPVFRSQVFKAIAPLVTALTVGLHQVSRAPLNDLVSAVREWGYGNKWSKDGTIGAVPLIARAANRLFTYLLAGTAVAMTLNPKKEGEEWNDYLERVMGLGGINAMVSRIPIAGTELASFLTFGRNARAQNSMLLGMMNNVESKMMKVSNAATDPSQAILAGLELAYYTGGTLYGLPVNETMKIKKAIEQGDVGYVINSAWGER